MYHLIGEFQTPTGKIDIVMINDLTLNTGKYIIRKDDEAIAGPGTANQVIKWLCDNQDEQV